jgi:hypothetical protein
MRTKRSSSFVVVVSAASVLWFLASIGNFSTAQELPKNDQTGSTLSREAWRKIMVRTPHPKPQGCFVATHPKIEWREVQCTKAPEKPYPPVPWPRPNVVGNGSDFSAQVTGSLSSAEGSFDLVSGVTSETGNGGAANNYSLQVNSNTFTTTTCNGATNPAVCRGWQQFVYSNVRKPLLEERYCRWCSGSTSLQPSQLNRHRYRNEWRDGYHRNVHRQQRILGIG